MSHDAGAATVRADDLDRPVDRREPVGETAQAATRARVGAPDAIVRHLDRQRAIGPLGLNEHVVRLSVLCDVGQRLGDGEVGRTLDGSRVSTRADLDRDVDRGSIGELFELLLEDDSVTVGNRLGIAPQRVRLLPAALAVYEAICELVPEPLRMARGGIREGLLLGRARERAAL